MSTSPAASAATAPAHLPDHRLPPPIVASLLSILVCVHVALIACCYLSTVAASSMQVRLLDAFRPYLAAMHFDADYVPLSLAASSPTEKTHVLMQTTSLTPEDGDWIPIAGPGIAGGERQRRWQRLLAAAAELSEDQQGDLVAWLAEPIASDYPKATQIRIQRQPDLMSTTADDAAPVPYRASIVRERDQPLRLVQVPPQRFTAPSTSHDHD